MKRVMEVIEESGLMVVVNKDTKDSEIKQLVEGGVKVIELRFPKDKHCLLVEEEMAKLSNLAGPDIVLCSIGLRSLDQLEAASRGGCDFFTPGSGDLLEEVWAGMVGIHYTFGLAGIFWNSNVKPRKLFPDPSAGFSKLMLMAEKNFGCDHKLIAMPQGILCKRDIRNIFRDGAYAVEVDIVNLHSWCAIYPNNLAGGVSSVLGEVTQGRDERKLLVRSK